MAERGAEGSDLAVGDRGKGSGEGRSRAPVDVDPQLAVRVGTPDPRDVAWALRLGEHPFLLISLPIHAKVLADITIGEGIDDLPSFQTSRPIVAGKLDRSLIMLWRDGQPAGIAHLSQEGFDCHGVVYGSHPRCQHETRGDHGNAQGCSSELKNPGATLHQTNPLVIESEIVKVIGAWASSAGGAEVASHTFHGSRAGIGSQASGAAMVGHSAVRSRCRAWGGL